MQDALSSERYSVIKDRQIQRSSSSPPVSSGRPSKGPIIEAALRRVHRETRFQEATRAKKKRPGGAGRDRTDDLRLAKPALSQLSYSPFSRKTSLVEVVNGFDRPRCLEDPDSRRGFPRRGARQLAKRGQSPSRLPPPRELDVASHTKWWAWVDSNHRPPAYQADALTRLSYRPVRTRSIEIDIREIVVRFPLLPRPGVHECIAVETGGVDTPVSKN